MEYTYKKFKELSDKLKKEHDFDLWLQHSPLATSIIFRKPIGEIMFKYSLCLGVVDKAYNEKTGEVDDVFRKYVHMFIFWDRNKEMIDDLVNDLSSPDSFDPDSDVPVGRMLESGTIVGGQLLGQASRPSGMF